MAQLKFKLLGKTWRIRLLSKKRFDKIHGVNEAFAATWSNRVMDLGPSGRDIETIRHELVHAYQKEMCMTSVEEMTNKDMEEWIAELVGRRGPELLQLADQIYTMIQMVEERKRAKKDDSGH